jgi:hypothetical protein
MLLRFSLLLPGWLLGGLLLLLLCYLLLLCWPVKFEQERNEGIPMLLQSQLPGRSARFAICKT